MSDIYKVNTSLPISTKIELLNDMILELNGLIEKARFDKNEITQIVADASIDRKYSRDVELGHTLTTYTGWTILSSEAGYSIWKYTPTNYTYNVLNALYLDNKVLENRGSANSESATAFDNVFLYNGDSGTGYTNLTTEAGTENGVSFELMDSVNDYLYVGEATTFGGISFEFEDKGSNYTLDCEYWNGSVWTTLDISGATYEDDTSNFSSDGRLHFTIPTNWATTTVNGVASKYWIRISTSTEPVTVAKAFLLVPADSVPNILKLSSTEIFDENWAWCSYSGSIYATIRNTGAAAYEGDYFIASSSSTINKQNYFIHNHTFTLDNEDSTYLTSNLFFNNTTKRLGVNKAVPLAALSVVEDTEGDPILSLETTETASGRSGSINCNFYQASNITTDGSTHKLFTFACSDNTSYFLIANVIARRTGGASGTAGDSAAYTVSACVKRTAAGVATLVGTVDQDVVLESQAGWNSTFTVSGNNVNLDILGATGNNVAWQATITIQSVA